jgi:hypothetical protein
VKLDRLLQELKNPLPRGSYLPSYRNTVCVGLIGCNNGFAVIQPLLYPSYWMPAQGPVDHRYSVASEARKVLRDEILSVRRKHPHGKPLINWDNPLYAGSAMNVNARSGIPKLVHAVIFQAMVPLPEFQFSEKAASDAQWVYSPEDLNSLLATTLRENPVKANIILGMATAAFERGWLV